MNLTFIHFAEFASGWKKLRLSDEDLQALEDQDNLTAVEKTRLKKLAEAL